MWELTGRDTGFLNLCNVLCSQRLIKGKQVLRLIALCLILVIITEHTWPVPVCMENTGQLRRFPTLLKTVKIKQAKPYYRSLKEHCWVSRERETERMREGERGKRNHASQSLTVTMCTEMKSLKLNPRIPLALWQASEKCCCSARHSLLPQPGLWWWRASAACLHSGIRLYTRFSRGWFALHIFGPPTQLQQAACSIQVFSPSLGAKDSTLGSGKGANHMLAPSATNTLWWRGTQLTHTN